LFVHEKLCDLVELAGHGSIEAKKKHVLSILEMLSEEEAAYLLKIISGSLRLNVLTLTVLQGFLKAIGASKADEEVAKRAYAVRSDLGEIIYQVGKNGFRSLKALCVPHFGIPIQSAAAERMSDAAEIIERCKGRCLVQPKYDGLRVQVHYDPLIKEVRLFSRNQLPMHEMFPEIQEALYKAFPQHLKGCVILDGEVIAYDMQAEVYKSFQATAQRRRKHEIEDQRAHNPVHIILFDCLMWDGENLLDEPCVMRYRCMQVKMTWIEPVVLIESKQMTSAADVKAYFDTYTDKGFEGIMVKDIDARYDAGKRSYAWIKWKRVHQAQLSDTLDVVVLGYYKGRGKRAGGIGAFLVGVYDSVQGGFATIAKVGTGLDEATWALLKKRCDEVCVASRPAHVFCHKALVPDVWCSPEIVVEVSADEITRSPLHTALVHGHNKGVALRFPRLVGVRFDKDVTQITKATELYALEKTRLE